MNGPCNLCDAATVCCGQYYPGRHGEMTCCDQPVTDWQCTGECRLAEEAYYADLTQPAEDIAQYNERLVGDVRADFREDTTALNPHPNTEEI